MAIAPSPSSPSLPSSSSPSSPSSPPLLRLLLLPLLLSLAAAAADSAPPLVLDGAAAHHTWDGFGGLSAGASSRLLRDYPEPQRGDILDLLYKPQHGASLQICKIEIGGDDMSTDGTEPSHEHSRGDRSCERGYELWLANAALQRNPAVKTFALAWGLPGWLGNGSGFFTPDTWAYMDSFCDCFLEKTGRTLDYIGVWNERSWFVSSPSFLSFTSSALSSAPTSIGAPARPPARPQPSRRLTSTATPARPPPPPSRTTRNTRRGSTDYIVGLRAALDAAGHGSTKIVLPDCAVATDPKLLEAIATNATFGAAFEVAGLHGDPVPVPVLEATGHKYWESETGFDPISLSQDWPGARSWARNLLRNYISANITGTVTWSTIWSVLPGLPYDGRGIMMANTRELQSRPDTSHLRNTHRLTTLTTPHSFPSAYLLSSPTSLVRQLRRQRAPLGQRAPRAVHGGRLAPPSHRPRRGHPSRAGRKRRRQLLRLCSGGRPLAAHARRRDHGRREPERQRHLPASQRAARRRHGPRRMADN